MSGEYISRKAAYNAIVNNYDTDDQLRDLDAIPAADVVKVRHGRWMSMDGDTTTVSLDEFGCPTDSCRCSECGDWLTASDEYSIRGRYCPNCGAKMDGGQEDV